MSKNLLIMGQGRSGTSCLTGILKEYGLHLGEVNNDSWINKKGTQESPAVNWQTNEKLLRLHGGSWYAPKKIVIIPDEIRQQVAKFKSYLVETNPHPHKIWGIKDPRMVFCWPAWVDSSTQFIGIFRHPLVVVDSLNSISHPDIEHSPAMWLDLWLQYNQELMALYQADPFPMVCFDWPEDRFRQAVKNIARRAGLTGEGPNTFFENTLRQSQPFDIPLPDTHRTLYEALTAIAEKESSLETV